MSSKMPPVPPAERSDKGPGSDPATTRDDTSRDKTVPDNTNQQGQTANIHQNTSNKGYQQGR